MPPPLFQRLGAKEFYVLGWENCIDMILHALTHSHYTQHHSLHLFFGVCGSTPSAGAVSETYGNFNDFFHVFLSLLSSHIQLHVIGEFLAYKYIPARNVARFLYAIEDTRCLLNNHVTERGEDDRWHTLALMPFYLVIQ